MNWRCSIGAYKVKESKIKKQKKNLKYDFQVFFISIGYGTA